MLDAELDLESDLSIDSIKRIEILGALAERLGLAESSEEDRDEMIEELAVKRTLGDMISWLEARLNGLTDLSEEDHTTSTKLIEDTSGVTRPKPEGDHLPRAVRCWVDAPLQHKRTDTNTHQTDDTSHEDQPHIEHLTIDHHTSEPMVNIFTHLQRLWGSEAPRWDGLIVSAPLPRNPDEALIFGGVSGLVKSAYRESSVNRRDVSVRVVLLSDCNDSMSILDLEADDLSADISSDHPPKLDLIRYDQDQRRQREEYILKPLSDASSTDQSTVASGADVRDVILVTGGARGVTARCIRSLAQSGVTLVLCGRTSHPQHAIISDLELARHATDELDLRRQLASTERLGLKELKSRARTA
jgi:hypothetical protein